MVFECSDLGEAPVAEGAVVRLLPGVGAHVALQAGGFEESLAAVAAEVGPLVVVLLAVEDGAVPVTELPPAVLTLQPNLVIIIKTDNYFEFVSMWTEIQAPCVFCPSRGRRDVV